MPLRMDEGIYLGIDPEASGLGLASIAAENVEAG